MIDQIRAKIAQATDQTPLREHLRTTLAGPSGPPASEVLDEAAAAAAAYVDLTPAALEEVMRSAAASGSLPHLLPLMQTVAAYVLEDHDLVPDHLGLLGLLDDALLTNRTLQVLSATSRELTGVPLLSQDLGPANATAATFLGADIASHLVRAADAAVSQQLYGPQIHGATQAGYVPQPGGTFEDGVSDFVGRYGHQFDGGGSISMDYSPDWGEMV